MKRYPFLLLSAFLTLTACTVHVGPPIPREEYREGYYSTLNGQVLSENGAPMPNVSVTMEEKNLYNGDRRDDRFLTAKTNNAGYFSFQVKRNRIGIIRISNDLLANESIKLRGPADSTPYGMGRDDFSVLPEEGTAYRNVTSVERGNGFRITVPYSRMGFAFNEIKRLYERDRNYREVVYEARNFLETFRNNSPYAAEVRWMAADSEKRLHGKMRSEFDALMALNEKRDFESVIYRGNDYIKEYRGVRDSRWEEVDRLVARAERYRHESEYSRREGEYSRHEDQDYSRHDEEHSRHGRESAERYKAIISLKETDYDAIISQGKAYIEEYGDLENGHSREVRRLVWEAERKKKLAEERDRELDRQRRIERDQAARDQAARDHASRDQAAKDQAAKDQAARDQAARDQASRDQAARDQASRDQASRDQASRDQASRDQASRDQASRDQAAKEQAAKEQAAKDQASRDQAAKDQASRDQAARDQASRDQASRDQAAKDQAARDQAARDQAAKDQAAKEQVSRGRGSRGQAAKEQVAQDQAANDQGAKDKAEKDKADKGKADKNKADKDKADKGKGEKGKADKDKGNKDKNGDKDKADKDKSDKDKEQKSESR